jgi:molybdenum cofactor cytidylyltransferase
VADLSSVGAVILAAGSSRRLGRPKQLLELEGKPLLQHVIDAAGAADVGEIVVVMGHMADDIAGAVSLPDNAQSVVNPDHATGQASSLRVGLAALGAGIDRAVVVLGDQPRVRADAIRAVAAAAHPIARAMYAGEPGHPVAFDRSVWAELCRIDGDQGARTLLTTRSGDVRPVELGETPPADVDTEADYLRIVGPG